MQSRRHSLLEVVTGTAVAFAISMLVQHLVVNPLWKLNTSFSQDLGITVLFTVVSVARSYVWRRFFNWLQNKNNNSHVTHRNHG
jgi:membrane protein implicated in regulation of membrane protease activity